MTQPSDADSRLSLLGADLAVAVTEALPTWVLSSVMERYDQYARSGHGPVMDRAAVAERAERAAGQAVGEIAEQLRRLLGSDVDAQWTTPLSLVRSVVRYAAEVLVAAGVPYVERDSFEVARFPDDHYRLTPASLASLDPEVGELALAWGASKALAHRARHEGGGGPHLKR